MKINFLSVDEYTDGFTSGNQFPQVQNIFVVIFEVIEIRFNLVEVSSGNYRANGAKGACNFHNCERETCKTAL
mgnify:CR=1 FL=1